MSHMVPVETVSTVCAHWHEMAIESQERVTVLEGALRVELALNTEFLELSVGDRREFFKDRINVIERVLNA